MGNSVIYRPAYDAEVEYLESTGTQYIDTGIVFNSPYTIELSFMLTKLNNYNSLIFGAWHDNDSTDRLQFYVANNNRFNNDGHSNITCVQPSVIPDTNTIYNITYTPTISQPNANSSMWLFARNNDRSTYLPYNGLRVYSCKIKDIDSDTVIRDFIPVRIGSVGYLYDKVSKQFFANKGTGNFILGNDVVNAVIPQQRCVLYFGNQRSVGFERIYEEYEWLCGRNGAYINTMHPANIGEDTFIVKGRYDGTMRNPLGDEQSIFGVVEKWSYSDDGIWCYTYISGGNEVKPILLKISASSTFPDNVPLRGLTKEFVVVLKKYNSDYYAENNGQGAIYSNLGVTDKTIGNVFLFTRNTENLPTQAAERYFQGDIAYFKITDTSSNTKMNLVPCKLLQSIPAILDGNGIARQAGECGMWDKVSNKFYGNVANSGTFTVKGPKCYEEYKWLKAEIPIGVAMMSLPINSSTFNCTIEHTGARANLPHLYSDGYIYFTNSSNMDMIAVWNVSEENIPFSASVGSLMIIESNEEYFKVNNISIIKYGFPITRMVIQSSYNSNNATTTKTSKITVDGIERYVPCKLTHGIPASMDANGISRPAGTCGMWDKVNDKFYGNVASSGSFTVSND